MSANNTLEDTPDITIKSENADDQTEAGGAGFDGIPQFDAAGPTLEEMLADPIGYRRYVAFLADNTPPAPSHVVGGEWKSWQYHQLLTATLNHLRTAFKDAVSPKQAAWEYYDRHLKVNREDYPESPFFEQRTVRGLFDHEAAGRRRCARMAAGLPEKKEKVRGEKRRKEVKKEGGQGGRKKRRTMLD